MHRHLRGHFHIKIVRFKNLDVLQYKMLFQNVVLKFNKTKLNYDIKIQIKNISKSTLE